MGGEARKALRKGRPCEHHKVLETTGLSRPQGQTTMNVSWQGVFPAATTQFHADQSLDLPSTLRHLHAMLAAGVHGLIMLGTVGENCSLEYREKLEVLKATAEHVAGRVSVLIGVAEGTTALACRFAARPQK